ncbi:MAG: ImmA/IrrE family metallo-endopeptidase [Thermoleophilia bacterium]|nr:ImmA/IrrE family metallo-endopeptidase [Thermoleophilia bacterium]
MTAGELDKDLIESRAYRLLADVPDWVWNGEELPVPIEEIVDSVFGLQVRYVESMSMAPGCEEIPHDQLSGLLLTSVGEIWVNAWEADEFPGRGRFTVGHELGHWTMHSVGRGSGETVHCRKVEAAGEETAEPESENRPPKPLPEKEADTFSAALLMPEHLIREHHALDPDVAGLCERFETSRKAMNYRLVSLALTS